MNIRFTNGHGEESEININGKCTITNYDTRAHKPVSEDDLTIEVNNDDATVKSGINIFQQDSQTINLDAKKYSIFNAIASMDGDNTSLSEADLAKAKKSYKKGDFLWGALSLLGVTEIRYDKKAGVATIVIGDKELLRIDFETENEQKANTKKQQEEPMFSLIGNSGFQISESILNQSLKSDQFDKKFLKIFELYNQDENTNVSDSEKLKAFFQDIMTFNSDGDKSLGPSELRNFLEERGLQDISVSDLNNFMLKITELSKLNELTSTKSKRLDITEIPSEIITSIISDYKDTTNNSLVIALYKSSKSEENLNALKNKLIMRAEQCNLEENEIAEFKRQFENAQDKDEFESIVNNFITKLLPKERLYNANKDGIINMMAGKKLNGQNLRSDKCTDDLNAVAEKIIYYANKYRPEDSIKQYINSSNPDIRALVNNLLSSEMLDYWPIFVAGIISQETGFRETGDIYHDWGNGVMQLTKTMIKEMYATPENFDEEKINQIKSEYPSVDDFYNNVITKEGNTELKYELGVLALRYKINYTLGLLQKGKMKTKMADNPSGTSAVIDNPTKLLEAAAMWYNGNQAKTDFKDPIYKSQTVVMKDYARNVITRFKQYAPGEVQTGKYYEWNPLVGKYVIKG